MLALLNRLLSKVPGNGKKTIIGIVLSAIALAWPDFPLSEGHVNQVLEAVGTLYLIVGLLHKWIKAKLA